MKNFVYLFFFCFFALTISAQGIPDLLKQDFQKQESLLIQMELNKSLGSRANSNEVKSLIQKLLPWAMMEGLSPETFSKALVRLIRAQDSGIEFETIEDLVPFFAEFQGTEDDFLWLIRFWKETSQAELPEDIKLHLVSVFQKKKWDGVSLFLSGRLAILGRKTQPENNLIAKTIADSLPPQLGLAKGNKVKEIWGNLCKQLKISPSEKLYLQTEKEITNLKSDTITGLEKSFLASARAVDSELLEIGRYEMSLRPKLDWILDDSGNLLDSSSQSSNQWQTLRVSSFQREVQSWLGTRYQFGGASKKGTDCSGFTSSVLRSDGISVPTYMIPRSARDQARMGLAIEKEKLLPGDLVFFSASQNPSKITHVGFAIGGGRFSHASSSKGVVVQGLDEKYWKEKYISSRRVFTSRTP